MPPSSPSPLAESSHASASARALTFAANAAFVPMGIVTILLGPMLPILSARWSLNDTQAGALFTAQFLASTLAVSLSGVLVARWGYRFAIGVGLATMGTGVGLLPFSSHELGIGCIALYGFGSGISTPAANLAVAEVNPTRRSGALSLLNFSWSIGAVACPFLISAAAAAHKISWLLVAVAIFMVIVAAGIAVANGRNSERAAEDRIVKGEDHAGHRQSQTFSSIHWRAHSLYMLAALFFLYVGAENACGGWTAALAKSLGTLPAAKAAMTPSFFYIALMIGRWVAPLFLRRIDDVHVARFAILLACVGMAGMLVSHEIISIAVSVSIAGLGLASVYPITIALLSREFGPTATMVGSIMFSMSNLGGACLPFLVGFFSTHFHNLRIGLAVPLIASGIMLILYRAKWNSASA
jgi:MFS transporter, FHS family, glucose/mannose:H+ symporter